MRPHSLHCWLPMGVIILKWHSSGTVILCTSVCIIYVTLPYDCLLFLSHCSTLCVNMLYSRLASPKKRLIKVHKRTWTRSWNWWIFKMLILTFMIMYQTVDNLVVAKQWFFISSALFRWLFNRKKKFSVIFPTFCLNIWGAFCMDTLYKYHSKGMPLRWTLLMSIIFIEFCSKVHFLLWALILWTQALILNKRKLWCFMFIFRVVVGAKMSICSITCTKIVTVPFFFPLHHKGPWKQILVQFQDPICNKDTCVIMWNVA